MAYQDKTGNLLGSSQQQQPTTNFFDPGGSAFSGGGTFSQQQATNNLLGSPSGFQGGVATHHQQATSALLSGPTGTAQFGASNFGTQQGATSSLLGPSGGTHAQQQGATSSLLAPSHQHAPSNFGTQQAATSSLLGPSAGTHAQQPTATSSLLAPSQGATANLLGSSPANQQPNTSRLLGTSALDMTAGQLTPLNEPPGTASAARMATKEEATNRLLGTTEGFPKQQASRLLGPSQGATQDPYGSSYPSQQGAMSTEGAATKQDATSRLMADGLRQRNLTQHARRALDRAEAEITRFGLVLNGEIQSAHLGSSGRGPLMCVFSMKHGADWTIVSGAQTGITQLATSSLPAATALSSAIFRGGDPREVVWNFPIGIAYKSTSPFGWPRLVVTVYGTDLCNRRVIKGYGSVHVPCQPGKHTRTIRLYCPVSSSPLTRLLGALFGNPAQLVDPRIVAETEGREVVRVQSGGKVTVTFDVLLKDTEPFNYSF